LAPQTLELWILLAVEINMLKVSFTFKSNPYPNTVPPSHVSANVFEGHLLDYIPVAVIYNIIYLLFIYS
jgi:hypothetical protein